MNGLPFRTFYYIIGNKIIINADKNQRTPTALEKYFGWTIYDKYIQTSGPAVKPKIAR